MTMEDRDLKELQARRDQDCRFLPGERPTWAQPLLGLKLVVCVEDAFGELTRWSEYQKTVGSKPIPRSWPDDDE